MNLQIIALDDYYWNEVKADGKYPYTLVTKEWAIDFPVYQIQFSTLTTEYFSINILVNKWHLLRNGFIENNNYFYFPDIENAKARYSLGYRIFNVKIQNSDLWAPGTYYIYNVSSMNEYMRTFFRIQFK